MRSNESGFLRAEQHLAKCAFVRASLRRRPPSRASADRAGPVPRPGSFAIASNMGKNSNWFPRICSTYPAAICAAAICIAESRTHSTRAVGTELYSVLSCRRNSLGTRPQAPATFNGSAANRPSTSRRFLGNVRLRRAAADGLEIRFLWHPGAFELLHGIIDVYVADFKFGNDACADRLAKVDRFVTIVTRNLDIAAGQADLIVRHLLLPGHFDCCYRPIVDWIARDLPGAKFSIRDGYLPLASPALWRVWRIRWIRGWRPRACELADFKSDFNVVD